MANPERGELDIEVAGTTYTLKLSTNAAATLQGRHKRSLGQMLREGDDLDVVAIRGILWCLLQKHHAAAFKTEEQVGDLIDAAGGFKAIIDKIGEVFALNADPNGTAPATATGTGMTSTSAPVESV